MGGRKILLLDMREIGNKLLTIRQRNGIAVVARLFTIFELVENYNYMKEGIGVTDPFFPTSWHFL